MDSLETGNYIKSNLLIEQHFHGCFGVDFSNCTENDLLSLSKKLLAKGIGGFFPTLVTDSVENIKKQIAIIKSAQKLQTPEMATILGIHLEGIFINPDKKGIHNPAHFLVPSVENFKLVEDDTIKIVTFAPELDEGSKLTKYLTLKGIKVQAGHCTGANLENIHGATHLFNAMSGISHREPSTSLSALLNDKIYTEIIADGIHLSDDIINLVMKTKPEEKIILVSDSLPIAASNLTKMSFAGEEIFFDGEKATSKSGTIAGSTAVLNEIIKNLALKAPKNFESIVKMASDNLFVYHNLELNGHIWWDENFDIVAVEKDGIVLYKE